MLFKRNLGFFSISNKIKTIQSDYSNINNSLLELIDRKIYKIESHPINTLYNKLKKFYSDNSLKKSELQSFLTPLAYEFKTKENPIVSKFENFDSLLILPDHISRQKTDTFYINEDTLLRTHTSAHQHENIKEHNRFCVFADVYRRDEIDATHYPAFHQMEGVSLYTFSELDSFSSAANKNLTNTDSEYYRQNPDYLYRPDLSSEKNLAYVRLVVEDMKQTHENLIKFLLQNEDIKMRWNSDYFPFTEPSYELEVYFNNRWVEMLGCGILIRSDSQKGNRYDEGEKFKRSNRMGEWNRNREIGDVAF